MLYRRNFICGRGLLLQVQATDFVIGLWINYCYVVNEFDIESKSELESL